MSNDERTREEAEAEARRRRSEKMAKRSYAPVFTGVIKRDSSKPRVTWQERQAEQAAIDAANAHERSHWRARLERQTRHRGRDALALIFLLFAGLTTMMVILSQQNTSLPGWVPIYGQDVLELEGELANAQGVTPGQGQAVMMNGVQIGLISDVRLEDGVAVVGMDVEDKYAPIIRADADILLRPRTNLNDMTVQIDPGSPDAPPIENGARITLANSASNIQPDQFFNALDGDTQAYLKLLLQGGAEAVGDGRGKALSAGFRRFEPFTRFIAEFNSALAERRKEMARAVHNFQLLTVELGNANQYSEKARTTLAELVPQAEALGPGLASTRRFFKQTTPALANQIRPFARQVKPVLADAAEGSGALDKTVTNFGDSLNSLNYGFNALAYDPGASKPGYLFYLPWLNHNLNANYIEDGAGSYRRAALLITCRAADLADGFVEERPSLKTVQQVTNAPRGKSEICPPGS